MNNTRQLMQARILLRMYGSVPFSRSLLSLSIEHALKPIPGIGIHTKRINPSIISPELNP